MKVERFVTGIISTNCYIVSNEETKEAIVIDPAACPSYLMSHIQSEGLTLKAILLTHGHFDHIMGIDDFLKEFDMPVYVHAEEEALICDASLNESSTYGPGYAFTGATYLKGGETLCLAGITFQVIYTPGHTSGGVCYYVETAHTLFSGDTLFCASVGRTDFPTSSMSALIHSIKEKLLCLPDETIVYPGHMGATTIGDEKIHNPFI